jgi:hypothetical protein
MSTITPGPLSKEERDRMELLVNELKSNGNYFRLRSKPLDMGFSVGRISRVIDMPDGSQRRISQLFYMESFYRR